MSDLSTGRLTQPVHAELRELLYDPQLARDRREVLPHLLRIDAAHVVMLAEQALLARDPAAELLALNHELTRRLRAGDDFLGAPSEHRGLYFLYERHCVERLGAQTGGAAHVARSRNDINAGVTRLRLRDELVALGADCCDLLDAAARLAEAQLETLVCGFTHRQPAQPTTVGHYVAGVLSELLRTAEWLDEAYDVVNRSPLGAAAGFGTSFGIDPGRVAQLLGFAGVVENSADAVASRDYVVRVLSPLALLCVTLTRLSTDLQEWAGAGHGFVGWPDELVSSSSIMPQKRNPFVLESVRGACGDVTGALVQVLMGLKSAPFTNSVEVGGEAVAGVWSALGSGRRALRLMRLMLDKIEVFPERMSAFLRGTQSTLTALADLLVSRHGLAFRSAHDAVGRLARELPAAATAREIKARLEPILRELVERPPVLDEAELARSLDAAACVAAAGFGGGPAPASVRSQLELLAGRRERLRTRLLARERALREAEIRLDDAAARVRRDPTASE